MTYTVRLSASAKRLLARLPGDIQERITLGVAALRVDPRPRGVVKLATAKNTYRIRVGDYRVIYEIHDDILLVLVVEVGHRREVYR